MVDMISASVRFLRYGGRLFPTKSVVAPDSNLFVPVLTTSVLMLLPPLQGTSTGAARSMPGLRAAEDTSSWLLAHRRSFCYSLASHQLSDLRTTRTVRTRSYKHERPWMWRARCTIRRRWLIIQGRSTPSEEHFEPTVLATTASVRPAL